MHFYLSTEVNYSFPFVFNSSLFQCLIVFSISRAIDISLSSTQQKIVCSCHEKRTLDPKPSFSSKLFFFCVPPLVGCCRLVPVVYNQSVFESGPGQQWPLSVSSQAAGEDLAGGVWLVPFRWIHRSVTGQTCWCWPRSPAAATETAAPRALIAPPWRRWSRDGRRGWPRWPGWRAGGGMTPAIAPRPGEGGGR